MPANIVFTISECTGEDVDAPCTELLSHTQDSRGWSTPKNCSYPQYLTLQLQQPARLQQIQLLSHEYKIAGKVELQVEDPIIPGEFTRLGFLSFDSNERSKFAARELKSVTLPDVEASALRLIIHRCHQNALNTQSQASLIMLNLVGEPLPVAPSAVTAPQPHPQLVATVAAPQPVATHLNRFSTSDQEGIDAVTAQRIEELQAEKLAAVSVEDYDEAKRLKQAIDRLKAAGAKMAELEARKKEAVEMEDYDTAKALKHELELMRSRTYAAVMRGETAVMPNSTNKSEQVRQDSIAVAQPEVIKSSAPLAPQQKPPMQSRNGRQSGAACAADAVMMASPSRGIEDAISVHESPGVSYNSSAAVEEKSFDRSSAQKPRGSGRHLTAPPPIINSEWANYDERPARAKGLYDLGAIEKLNADTPPPGAAPLRRIDANAGTSATALAAEFGANAPAAPAAVYTGPPAPAGFPSELPYPEPLSADDSKEAGPLQSIVGEFLTRCMYSRIWQLREAALTTLATAVVSTSSSTVLQNVDGNGDAVRLLCGLAAQELKAKIPAVAAAALTLLRSITNAASVRRFPAKDLHACLTELVPVVAERAADASLRIREQVIESLVDMARVKESGLKSMGWMFVRPYKKSESPKATLGRLQLVAALLPVLGVAAAGSHQLEPSGFNADSVVQFAAPALTSANAEVRSAASDLVVKVGRAPGVGAEAVLPLLPVELNPKLREQLEVDLTGKQVERRPSRTSAVPHSRRGSTAKPQTSGSPDQQGAGSGVTPQKKRASTSSQRRSCAAAKTPSSRNAGRSSSSQHAQNEAASSKRPAAGAPRYSSSSHTAQPPTTQSPPIANPISAYRPSHPEEHPPAMSSQPAPSHSSPPQDPPNLADLYPEDTYLASSAGGPEYSVADEDPAPFEAELRRREATLGPSHPAVAEAASNLAIVYNQRGEGLRALPLYQRALSIWESSYGPNHSDIAHALTDIAVILLEAGHDGEGKELLRKALDIQNVLLGPDHPDVMAIRDVLEEDL